MFDTQYNTGLSGCATSYGLGSCGGERAERSRRSHHRDHIRDAEIPSLRKQLESLKNGAEIKLFYQLEKEVEQLNVKLSQLKAQKLQILKLRDTWRDNPEVAAGMGWRFFERVFSCGHYERDIKHINQEIGHLDTEKKGLQKEVDFYKGKIKNTNEIVASKNKLLQEIQGIEQEIQSYGAEIESIKTARTARIEAEKLAIEQERQRREQEILNASQKAKANNSSMLLLLGGAAVVGFIVLSKGKNKTVVKVKG